MDTPANSNPSNGKSKTDTPANNNPSKGKSKFTCEVCKQKFPSQMALWAHLQNVHGYSPDLIKLEQEKKKNRKLFNTDNAVRSVKKHTLIIIPFVILLIILGVYLVFVAPSNVGLVYTEVTYGSLFSKISSLVSSGFSSVSTFIAEIQNPNLLITQPQVTSTNTTPTFSSFLSMAYPSGQVVTLTSNPQPGSIYYSVTNNGNVPLGPGTPNDLLVNISCGSTVSSGAATYCKDMLSSFTNPVQTSSSPPKIADASLLNILVPGETKENTTSFTLSCPTAKLTFPLSMSFLASFLVKNYTAAVILPVEFMSNSFQNKLISSNQAFIPSEPSFNFYSSGPVQIEIYPEIKQPVLTKIDSLPLEIAIKNNGNSPYEINNLSIYISKQFYPVNPSSSYWTCSNAVAITRQGFTFPGSGYWDCYINSKRTLSSGPDFYLDLNAVNTLSGMHFNTMTIIGYVNYNYNESFNMPVVVSNQTCTS